MKIEETALDGVLVLTPNVYRDDRGAFLETWNLRSITEAGLPSTWVQDNYSLSKKNVLRGLHYQVIQPQGKLVRVTHGAVLDVAVDLRRSSPNFGKHVAIQLDEDSGRMLWIPIGFGHAFLALTAVAGFAYKVTDYYAPGGERTIMWNDPELAIEWPVEPGDAIVSAKDQKPLERGKSGASFPATTPRRNGGSTIKLDLVNRYASKALYFDSHLRLA